MTDVSVIVCTCNRATSVVDTLRSLAGMDVPDELTWEVLVVDNNSTDNTGEMITRFMEEGHKRFHYLFEPKQGKCHALNLAIGRARGRIVAFTDDDALVDSHWLTAIVDTMKNTDADCAGGKVLPIWEGIRPAWLSDGLLNVLALLDYGEKTFHFERRNSTSMLFGVNFAFRKDFFAKEGLFKVELGSRGEDQEMFERLLAANGKAVYNPKIVVHHKIGPQRLTKAYYRRWYAESGKARARLHMPSKRTVFGIPGYALKQSLKRLNAFIRSAVTLNKSDFFSNELWLIFYYAFFVGKIKHSLLHRNVLEGRDV